VNNNDNDNDDNTMMGITQEVLTTACDALLQEALVRGSKDNLSVILMYLYGSSGLFEPENTPREINNDNNNNNNNNNNINDSLVSSMSDLHINTTHHKITSSPSSSSSSVVVDKAVPGSRDLAQPITAILEVDYHINLLVTSFHTLC
jgi:hypothetical protein